MQKSREEQEPEPWDRKKVLIFLGVLAIILISIYELYSFSGAGKNSYSDVQGVFTQKAIPTLNPQASEKFNKKIDEIKEKVNSLDVTEVATSSPQVKKVIEDIKALENLPRNQAKEACENICSSL